MFPDYVASTLDLTCNTGRNGPVKRQDDQTVDAAALMSVGFCGQDTMSNKHAGRQVTAVLGDSSSINRRSD